jgi:hypothetical protein
MDALKAIAVLLASALPFSRHALACEAPTDTVDVARAMLRAADAFYQLDAESFAEAREETVAAMVCLEEPLQQRQAADFHRLEALAAYLERDERRARAQLEAALGIEPNFDLVELLPSDHPLHALYDEARSGRRAEPELLTVEEGVASYWDGAPPAAVAAGWPGLLQLADGRGRVFYNDLVAAGAKLELPPEAQRAPKAWRPYASLGLGYRNIASSEVYRGHLDSALVFFGGWYASAVRLELGAEGRGWRWGALMVASIHDGTPLEAQEDLRGHAPGDAYLFQPGVTVQHPWAGEKVELIPRLSAGVARYRAPMTDEAYRKRSEDYGAVGGLEPTETGPWAGLALGVGPARTPGRPQLRLDATLDLILVGTPLVVPGVQIGALAAF